MKLHLYLKTFEVMIYYNVLYSYRFYIYQEILFIIINNSFHEVYTYFLYFFNNPFVIFIYYIYLFIYLLESYSIKLKRSIINALLQIAYFQKALSVRDMEYFMYSSMFRQFNVYSIVEEPRRLYLPGTLELSTFISKLLVFFGHTLTYKKSSQKF